MGAGVRDLDVVRPADIGEPSVFHHARSFFPFIAAGLPGFCNRFDWVFQCFINFYSAARKSWASISFSFALFIITS